MGRPSWGMCPNCGQPVTVWGNHWRCGWCNAGGQLNSTAANNTVTITFSVVPVPPNLLKIWTEIKNELREMYPGVGKGMFGDLGKVVLHEIARSIRQAKEGPEQAERNQMLARFLRDASELGKMATISMVQSDGTLFREIAELSEQGCGKFWADLISVLPVQAYYAGGVEEDNLSALFWNLGQLYEYFSGTEEDNGRQKREWELKDAFFAHWEQYVETHPDGARAKRLLSRGEFPQGEDICREILVADYASRLKNYDIEELGEYLFWQQIIEAVLEQDAVLGITMWRTLLDAAQPCLRENEHVARRLLRNWIVREWLYSGDREHLMPFLSALEEERFARQVFQSACVGTLQADLLRACNRLERMALGSHLLDLLKSSPFPREKWQFPLEYYERAFQKGLVLRGRRNFVRAAEKMESSQSDDGTEYSFCMVQVEEIPRPLAYMTGGLPLQVGDQVEVPVGRENTPKAGRVVQVRNYTRAEAPWPPERTKTVCKKLP